MARDASVAFFGTSNTSLRIRPETQRLEFITDDLTNAWGSMHWFGGSSELSLDFVAMGVDAVSFDVQGDLSPQAPLWVMVLFTTSAAYPPPLAERVLVLTAPGKVTIPIGDFDLRNGNGLLNVDHIWFEFGDCNELGCTPYGGARNVSFGPLTIHNTVTAATPATWGLVKSVYR